MNKLNWDDLKFFLTLYETNTVSAAANRLNVNYATVSRRIDRLEESLKLKLFDRTQDGYLSTIEGTKLYEMSVNMRNEIASLEEQFSPESRLKQSTKISMVPFLAEHFVIEKLYNLFNKFPELRFEIETSNKNVNISKQEADIALRLDLPETGESICRKLGEIDYVLYGNEYWINKVKNSEEVKIITYSTIYSYLPECKYLISKYGMKSIVMQTNTVSAQKKAAENGYGVSLIPRITINESLNRYAFPSEDIKREIWMLTSKKAMASTPKKLVIEELVKIFKSELNN